MNFFTSDHSGALCDGQQQSSSASEQPLDLPPPGLQSQTDDNQTIRHIMLCLLLIVSLLAVRMRVLCEALFSHERVFIFLISVKNMNEINHDSMWKTFSKGEEYFLVSVFV